MAGYRGQHFSRMKRGISYGYSWLLSPLELGATVRRGGYLYPKSDNVLSRHCGLKAEGIKKHYFSRLPILIDGGLKNENLQDG